jgi:hypothetical protein
MGEQKHRSAKFLILALHGRKFILKKITQSLTLKGFQIFIFAKLNQEHNPFKTEPKA